MTFLLAIFISTFFILQEIQCFTVPRAITKNPNINVSPLSTSPSQPKATILKSSNNSYDDDEEEDPMKIWKEQYPELEFINYDDPEYAIDQGTDETMFPIISPNEYASKSKEEIELGIEAMREDRRSKNDIYQFETYFKNIWKSGKYDFFGDWTVYDTVLEDGAIKALRRRKALQKVVSKAMREVGDDDVTLIRHSEECMEGKEVLRYHPEEIRPFDFRGPQGIMTVGNAYTICDTTTLHHEGSSEQSNEHSGPYKTMNAEVGLYKDNLRFRLKLSYAIHEEDTLDDSITSTHPPLYLKNVVICRETTLDFPNPDKHTTLYESLGAPGGIYDPPPIRKENQYLQLDLEGRATALFPSKIDQDMDDGTGWVMTLDWTTDELRYQADRKVFGGLGIKGLYRLELSEVRSEDSELWRPKKGPQNMTQ